MIYCNIIKKKDLDQDYDKSFQRHYVEDNNVIYDRNDYCSES